MERVLKQAWVKSFVLLAIIFAAAQSSFATTAVRPSDDDLVIGARAIVRGKVVSIQSAIDEPTNRIYTYITVKVQEVIKGQVSERRIVIKEMGGRVGDQITVIYGNPQFTKGERVLLYLDTWADGSLRTYQMFLGKFSIVQDEATGQRVVQRNMTESNVVVINSHTPGAPSTDEMEVSAYVDMVRRRMAATAEAAREFEAKYYGGVPVNAEPAEFARVATEGEFSPQFTFLGNARWFQPDDGQAVPYTVNPNPPPASVPQLLVPEADVAAAANAWSTISGCSLRVSYSGPLSQCYTQSGTPGINVVSNNCDGRNAASASCAGILAWGGWSGGGSRSRTINGTTFSQITQGFISFNPYAICYFGNHCNVQEITTHELGHALGLGHSWQSSFGGSATPAQFAATMYYAAHFDGRCASVRDDDIAGITAIYPGTGGGPGPLSIGTSSLASGTASSAYSQTLVASGGTVPYSWSIVAGSLPPGLGLTAATGLISGTPNTTGTYNFTVKVTDSTAGTPGSAQKDLSIVITQSGGSPYSAQFISQTVPTSAAPGASFVVNMKFLNTGTQTWTGTNLYYIASQNPSLNQTWGGNGVSLNNASAIGPGQTLDIDFQVAAPTTAGTYNFQWQMYRNDGVVAFFGQASTNVAIAVGSAPPPPTNNAAFVSQSVPTTLNTSQATSVTVTMQNTGSTSWAAGTYYLGSLNPQANMNWGLNRVNIASSVAPGSNASFTFNVTAPSSPATYNFQWQMADSAGYFGSPSTNMAVTVSQPPATKKAAMDFDGDGKSDFGYYRNGMWAVLKSGQNFSFASAQFFSWGGAGQQPIVADFDGDGKSDVAYVAPPSGGQSAAYAILKSSTNYSFAQAQFMGAGWPSLGDTPVVGDFDGDGKADPGVWRPSGGVWIIPLSSTNYTSYLFSSWGQPGDVILPR